MRPNQRFIRAVSTALLAAGLLASCTKACNSAGATSGVTFDLRQILAHQQDRVRVRACVEDTCVTHTASPLRSGYVEVDDPAISGPATVSASLTVTDLSGRPIFDATADAELQKIQPNGPDCPPTAYTALVTAAPDGQLVQKQPL